MEVGQLSLNQAKSSDLFVFIICLTRNLAFRADIWRSFSAFSVHSLMFVSNKYAPSFALSAKVLVFDILPQIRTLKLNLACMVAKSLRPHHEMKPWECNQNGNYVGEPSQKPVDQGLGDACNGFRPSTA